MSHYDMVTIKGKDINSLYIKTCKELAKNGKPRISRGEPTIELVGVTLVLEDPTKSIVNLPERRKNHLLSYRYLEREFAWYLSGSLTIDEIVKGSHIWKEIQNSNGTVNSNYGFLSLIETWNGRSQLEWCIDKLKEDIYTRQAIINYSNPRDKYDGNKDFVCTIDQQFLFVDNRLDCFTSMRSNDIVLGLVTDVPWFSYLHERIARDLNIKLGRYHHYARSLHAYKKDWDLIERIANTKISNQTEKDAKLIWKLWGQFTRNEIPSFYDSLIKSKLIAI